MKESLKKILKEAGQLLLSFWHKGVGETQKENGYFTEADIQTERFLKEKLYQLKPADFWAEESGFEKHEDNGFHWVIDPLDGTTNFAHHVPYFCVSVALTEQDQPIVAAIYNPILDEFFYAERGAGAEMNGQRIAISHPESFSQAIIGVSLSYKHQERLDVINIAGEVSREARAIRHYGAVALDLANMACGRIDGVLFARLFWWDVAAGLLLVQEAGGNITEFDGRPIDSTFQSCVAGSDLVWHKLRKLARKPSGS